ncbi:MAG: hypothetical protein NVSMB26_04540 [Beijerinckiaceae bacterium]
MQSITGIRGEIGTTGDRDAGWSKIVFIGLLCALGGIGFLGATVLMNGRALSSYWHPKVQALPELPAAPVAETKLPEPIKPKAPRNDHFRPVDFVAPAEINQAVLIRCRSHVEAGRAFESLSPEQVAAKRAQRDLGERDSEAICRDYLAKDQRDR